jgi:hypothetical protein
MIEFLGANMAFKKSVAGNGILYRTDLGVGTDKLGEETDLFNRFLKDKRKIYYCGQAVVRHPVDLKRLKLGKIAQWNKALARYRFAVDERGEIDRSVTYYFGMPRYLIKNIMGTAGSLPLKIFDQREFLKAWITLSRALGRMGEIRKKYYDTR